MRDLFSSQGSESWSAQGNHSMALALRGPVDDDSESDANDTRSFVNHAEGSDGGRSVDVNAMNQALAISSDQMALQAQSPGGDASGTGKDCMSPFAKLLSLFTHCLFNRQEGYACVICVI